MDSAVRKDCASSQETFTTASVLLGMAHMAESPVMAFKMHRRMIWAMIQTAV
jgi:hypothetical protein